MVLVLQSQDTVENAESPELSGSSPRDFQDACEERCWEMEFRRIPMAVWATDRALRFTYARASVADLFEIDPRQVIGKPVDEGFVAAAEPAVVQHHLLAIEGQPQSFRWWTNERCFDVLIEAMPDEQGEIIGCVGTAVDVTELVAAKQELADTRRRFEEAQKVAHVGSFKSLSLLEATLNATADGLLVVDLDGRVTAYNQTFVTLWRIPEAIAVQRDDAALLAAVLDQLEDPDRFLHQVRELYDKPEQRSFDVLTFKDGRVFERYSTPQRLDTRVVGRVWSFRDVTERARAEREANEAINILSIAAHDVRSPLGGLALQLDVMENAMLTGISEPRALRHQIATCQRFVTRATSLLNGLLDVTQIGAGKVTFDIEPVDLVRLTREVVARAEADLAAAHCEVVVRADAAVEGRWDLARVDQIVTNLLLNAIKYGRGRPIEIEVRTEIAGCTWRIRDHGLGISTENQRRIFNQFERGFVAGEGIGLGLWIVRQLVIALGGSVDVVSTEGEGSTFTLTLPPSSPG